MKAFAVNSSDLGGPTNPQGIWSPQFLVLKRAVDHDADPDNVLQALSDWLSSRGKTGVEAILRLEPDQALDALLQKIGGGLDRRRLPPAAVATLHKAVQRLASRHIEASEREMEQERGRLSAMRQRFSLDPEQVVNEMLK